MLWIGTKPPRPPLDGGRFVAALTLDALAAQGVEVTIVAPCDAGPQGAAPERLAAASPGPRNWAGAAARSVWSGRPLTIERHAAPRSRLAAIDPAAFDVVHAEQIQALDGARRARASGCPCVVRVHNIESDVWEAAAGRRAWPMRTALAIEARRLRRFEAAALAAADAVVALSARDAAAVRRLAPGAAVHLVPPPGPAVADPGRDRLAGDPALVWIGSRGWPPNAAALDWLMTAIWPAIAARLPNARLHVFGGASVRGSGAALVHDAPPHSAVAFASNAIVLLPLRDPAGVRMRVLEAWARGVPVVGARAAFEGLVTADGRDVLVADDPAAWVDAVSRLAASPSLRARLVEGGRARLAERHHPAAVADALARVYQQAIDGARARRRSRAPAGAS